MCRRSRSRVSNRRPRSGPSPSSHEKITRTDASARSPRLALAIRNMNPFPRGTERPVPDGGRGVYAEEERLGEAAHRRGRRRPNQRAWSERQVDECEYHVDGEIADERQKIELAPADSRQVLVDGDGPKPRQSVTARVERSVPIQQPISRVSGHHLTEAEVADLVRIERGERVSVRAHFDVSFRRVQALYLRATNDQAPGAPEQAKWPTPRPPGARIKDEPATDGSGVVSRLLARRARCPDGSSTRRRSSSARSSSAR